MVTTITALPTAPSRSDDGDTFTALADAWVAALGGFTTEMNTLADEIEALAGAAFVGTSTTSNSIGTGAKTFTTQASLSFSAGQSIVAASVSGPTNYMTGSVTSYNASTGELVTNMTASGGSGTKTDWTIGLTPSSAAVLLAGSTMTGGLVLPAGTTSLVPLRVPAGVAHSSPTNGDLHTTTTGLFIRLNGTTYQVAPVPECTDSEGWTGSSTTTALTPRRLFTLAAPVALTDGATITPNFNTGLNFTVTLGGNRTLANPTNAKEGQAGVIKVTQDGTGSRTLAYGSNWRFPGGAAAGGVLSTAAGSVDMIGYVVLSGIVYATLSKAFAA